ncbi:Imm49 family immunity protein [Halovenus rubra]|uniref:Imm49 family immunity protein n=2 Tax=Halovenus rubra TaxID=869890 RepID=A0ABD5XDT1_9EURY|nr:Imm49 family immunity protein [Halovenus rubra]
MREITLTEDEKERAKSSAEYNEKQLRRKYDQEYFEEIPDEKVPTVLFGKALDHEFLAKYSLFEGKIEQAREHFQQYIEAFVQNCEKVVVTDGVEGGIVLVPLKLRNALYAALILEDETEIERLTTKILDLPREVEFPWEGVDEMIAFDEEEYHQAKIIAMLVRGETEDLSSHLDVTNELREEKDGLAARYLTGIDTFANGILEEDEATIEAGITTTLNAHHNDTHQHEKRDIEGLMMSLEATGHYKLAHRHGFDVRLDSPYIPDSVHE